MINVSKLLTSVKMDLGLYGLSLPFEDTDETFMDIIKIKSIPTFSEYFPKVLNLTLDLRTLEKIQDNYNESIFVLPDAFGDKEILYVRQVQQKSRISGRMGYMGGMDTFNGMMMTQVNADLMSLVEPAFTFKFTRPNKLHLFNITAMHNMIDIELGMEHDENLMSIPNSSYTSFLKLVTLDIKEFLYNQMKHYNDIQTAHGTISLKIEDWSDAVSERKELIEKWEDSYHLDGPQVFII